MGFFHFRVRPRTPNLLLSHLLRRPGRQHPLALESAISAHSTLYHDFLMEAGSPHCILP